MNWVAHRESWTVIFRQYLPRLALFSLAWEILQLPLYTIWTTSPWQSIVFAVAHCTVGDAMIGMAAMVISLMLVRAGKPANWPQTTIAIITVLLTLAYTVFSERINLAQGSWNYSYWMPIVGWIDVGLAPLAQWIVVPLLALWRASRAHVLTGHGL